jgi:hypothetical protein
MRLIKIVDKYIVKVVNRDEKLSTQQIINGLISAVKGTIDCISSLNRRLNHGEYPHTAGDDDLLTPEVYPDSYPIPIRAGRNCFEGTAHFAN